MAWIQCAPNIPGGAVNTLGTSSDMIYYIAQYTRTAQTCRFTRKCIITYNEVFEKKLNIHNLFIPLYLYYIIIMLKKKPKQIVC